MPCDKVTKQHSLQICDIAHIEKNSEIAER